MIYVIAKSIAKSDKIEDTKKALQALLTPTREEEGCIQYDLHQDLEKPEVFIFYEKWENRILLERHLKSAHLQQWGQQQNDLLAVPMEVFIMDRL